MNLTLSQMSRTTTSLTEQERDVIKRAILLISQVEVAVKSYWSNIGKHLQARDCRHGCGIWWRGGDSLPCLLRDSDEAGIGEEFTYLLENEPVLNRGNYLNKYVDRVFEDDKKQFLYSLSSSLSSRKTSPCSASSTLCSDSIDSRPCSRTPLTWCSTPRRKRTCTLRVG